MAKKNPNKYAYGSSGKGGTPHVVGELFQMSSGTQLLHVPYKGTGPAVIDLAAGQIQAMFVGLPATGAFMSKGTLRLLATAEATRSPLMPDVPTMKELGYPGVETSNWFGLFGPANTPTAVVDKIAAELSKISKSEDIRKAFAELGAVPAISTAPVRMPERSGGGTHSSDERPTACREVVRGRSCAAPSSLAKSLIGKVKPICHFRNVFPTRVFQQCARFSSL